MAKKEKILIIGAGGQIGQELTEALIMKYGKSQVIISDKLKYIPDLPTDFIYRQLDVLDKNLLTETVRNEGVTQIFHLAALLSGSAEKNPQLAWQVNMQGLLNVLETAVAQKVSKVFWPSSIAVFGNQSPKINCPQHTVTEPSSIYGISKCAGEYWCNYYYEKYGLDVRSVRYPGLISYKAAPGGGTTDYAVDIFVSAVNNQEYTCFLEADTALPMMYMPDAIRATIQLMDAPAEKLSVRTSYNLSALSFTPEELTAAIRQEIPDFRIAYKPDFRQKIADSWPDSIDDHFARADWNWKAEYDLKTMVKEMLEGERLKNHHNSFASCS